MSHTITLPNSAFLGNFEKFANINTFPIVPTPITLSLPNSPLVSIHPVISAMLRSINPSLTSPHLNDSYRIQSSQDLDDYFDHSLTHFHLNQQDNLLVKYILSELTRNTLEHSQDPSGATISLSYSQKSHTIRVGVADRGIGIKKSISPNNQDMSDYDSIIHALTPGVTGGAQTPGGTSENAGAGLFFVKSLAHQLGSHFLLYSGSGLFKLLKRKTVRNILRSDSTKDHASGGNDYPYFQGTAVGVDIPLNTLPDFGAAITQIRDKFYQSVRNDILPSTSARFT